jgi:uncharacterized protein (DUF924 family)
MPQHSPTDIVQFWREAGPEKWFAKDAAFDAAIRTRFLVDYQAAAAGELAHWEASADGSFALLLLLDQFPRNLFRDSAQAYATDDAALAIADRAIVNGFDGMFPLPERRFFYTPHMHAEDLAQQERCLALCAASGDEEGVKYAVIHRDIIRDFGRFPHRNRVLGRQTTPEEQAFLDSGGFSG